MIPTFLLRLESLLYMEDFKCTKKMKNIMLIISFLMLIFSCENIAVEPTEMGKIEGKVTIAPLCGNIPAVTTNNNPCGLSNEALDQIYAKYKVVITGDNNGKIVSNEKILDKTGLFSFDVPVGSYSLEVILPDGTMKTNQPLNELKKTVNITKNQTEIINLNVNTGIQ